MFDFGLNLIWLRKEFGFTQKELAAILGVSVNTVFNWENNYVLPNLAPLLQLSDLYGVSINYLTGMDRKRAVSLNGLAEDEQELLVSLYEVLKNGQGQEAQDRAGQLVAELEKRFNSFRVDDSTM